MNLITRPHIFCLMVYSSIILTLLMPAYDSASSQLLASTPYRDFPDWESRPNGFHSVGIALADMDNDGLLDLIVSNGADSGREPIEVFYNQHERLIEDVAGWQSADSAFHGNLAIGDVNNDGFPDLAVSVLFNNVAYADSGFVKLYINKNGRLEDLPSWRSADTFNSYACAFGDPDGDGDLDLLVMAGEPVEELRDRSRIYYNENGALQDTPGWQHELPYLGGDAVWADFDRNGIGEPLMVYHLEPSRIFGNDGSTINERDKWFSQDRAFYARDVTSADMDNDGWPDILTANGGYAAGAGYIKYYRNEQGDDPNSGMGRTPHWRSVVLDVNTAVRSFDYDGDGFRDIIATAWNRGLLTFRSNAGEFAMSPSWESRSSAVNESLALGDIDNGDLHELEFVFTADAQGRNFFTLGNAPFRSVTHVQVDDVVLGPEFYCFQGHQGWLSLSNQFRSSTVTIRVERSTHLDAAVATWNPDRGNVIYYYDPVRVDVAESSALAANAHGIPQLELGPVPAQDRLYLGMPRWGSIADLLLVAEWQIHDLLGRKLLEGSQSLSRGQAGFALELQSLEPGSYLLEVRVGTQVLQAQFVVAP